MTIIDWLIGKEARFPIAKATGVMLDKEGLDKIAAVKYQKPFGNAL
jgi:hypothetical protein